MFKHTSRKRRLYESFLSEVPILSSLQPQERAKIADVLESKTYTEGEDVIKQGEAGEEFFLIESGSAVAIKTGPDGKESVVKQYTKGDYFGGGFWALSSIAASGWSELTNFRVGSPQPSSTSSLSQGHF